jgi:hypothetical protein
MPCLGISNVIVFRVGKEWKARLAEHSTHSTCWIHIYVHCRIIYNLFVRALETGGKASHWWDFLSYFAASANEFHIFLLCTYIVFILQYQKDQINCHICVKRSETSVVLIMLMVSSVKSVLILLPSLNMNKIPEKLYIGQWSYIAKHYPVNVI